MVLAAAGTKVTRSYFYPDGRFWDRRLEVRLFNFADLFRYSPLSQMATQVIMATHEDHSTADPVVESASVAVTP